MEEITNSIREIAFFLIISNIVSSLVRSENYKKYIKLVSGIIIIFIVLNPLKSIMNNSDIMTEFEKDYKEYTIIEMDKSLGKLSDKIVNITLNEYETEVSNEISKVLEAKGFKIKEVYSKLEVNKDNSIEIIQIEIRFEAMDYNESLKETTEIYIKELLNERYGINETNVNIEF